jgi:hypothetical protein
MSKRATRSEAERVKKIASAELLDRAEPLDDAEQQKVIQELRETAVRQSNNGRKYFSILFKMIAIVFMYTLLYSVQNPWQISHQVALSMWIPRWLFHAYYFAMALCYSCAGLAIGQGIMKTRVGIRVFVLVLAAISSLAWLFLFVRFKVTEWSLFWLPLAPGACLGLAIYVDWDADNNILQVEELAGLRYDYKRV